MPRLELSPQCWTRAPVDQPLRIFRGGFQGALTSGMLPASAKLIPTSIRASGQSFCFGGGRGSGLVVPATVGILAGSLPLETAVGSAPSAQT